MSYLLYPTLNVFVDADHLSCTHGPRTVPMAASPQPVKRTDRGLPARGGSKPCSLDWNLLMLSVVITGALFVTSVVYFKSAEKDFADLV